jgi:hypothetical protein
MPISGIMMSCLCLCAAEGVGGSSPIIAGLFGRVVFGQGWFHDGISSLLFVIEVAVLKGGHLAALEVRDADGSP